MLPEPMLPEPMLPEQTLPVPEQVPEPVQPERKLPAASTLLVRQQQALLLSCCMLQAGLPKESATIWMISSYLTFLI